MEQPTGNGSVSKENIIAHHPWDEPDAATIEVSLPGAEINASTEKPTILEVLNNVSATNRAKQSTAETSAESASQADSGHKNVSSDHLVSSHSKLPTEEGSSFSKRVRLSDADNVLDIESHLIETYDEYQTQEDSVGINELLPIEDELARGTSKIATGVNVRSVVEVEPAGAKGKKPIETILESGSIYNRRLDGVGNDINRRQIVGEDIKRTAEKLVSEIEQQVLETLRNIETVKQAETEKAQEETAAQKKTDEQTTFLETKLTREVDEQLSEVTSILKAAVPSINLNGESCSSGSKQINNNDLKVVDFPTPKTPLEEEERKLFIDSLPQIGSTETDANKLSTDCKRDYYQSLKKYLIQSHPDKPPVPLQTYRWEDLRRAKERGGYPWTHLYKRPLGPDEEPEIVLLLRKSQELRFTSESPKSQKKVRIDEQVSIKKSQPYIRELSEQYEQQAADYDDEHAHHASDPTDDEQEGQDERRSVHSETISFLSDSVLTAKKPRKSNRLAKLRGILKHRKSGRPKGDTQSLPGTSTHASRHHSEESLPTSIEKAKFVINGTSPEKTPRCYPIMKKLKSMADRQKKRLHIKRITLKKDEKIVLGDETKILKLKNSPKSERSEIPHFIEKQDSDDLLEIIELDESPSRKRRDDGRTEEDDVPMEEAKTSAAIVEPDEIIEITAAAHKTESQTNVNETNDSAPPKKAPRLRREHVYEEIEQAEGVGAPLNDVLEMSSVEALKQSLAKQDDSALKDIAEANKHLPIDRMGSCEEEQLAVAVDSRPTSLLAPLSSIDSTSSDEDRNRIQLSPVAEESDDGTLTDREAAQMLRVIEEHEQAELRPTIKREASPAPSDKKVTFSHVEDEAEPHREDIELPEHIREATAAANSSKWKNMSDHEYEPIAAPPGEDDKKRILSKEPSPLPQSTTISMDIDVSRDDLKKVEDLQKDLEERYFSSEATTPRTESRTDYEIHTSQVDSSALEELPLKPENRKKGLMASAQDRTRKMQAGLKNQAGKLKTKLHSSAVKKTPSGSPKAKERKRFKAPEFSKIKMPEIKRPDMSKLKEFKRPEFTKFNKPDMSKFKFSTLKLRRSKSFKENEPVHDDDDMSAVTPESGVGVATAKAAAQPQKKMFEFNFGTYPRAFRKKKKIAEPIPAFDSVTGTEVPSVIPSTETQPSVESSSSPQGDRGPGPVRSRWADKFSDVSYNDSEGSRYRRYGSEQESFDRESSLERRMKDDLEEETGSEAAEMGILGGAPDNKQFAEFDEENRAIHEISNLRAGEFKRRPMVHQDSDLRSEDSKEVLGWTDKEIQKNKLLRKAELEAEASYLKYPSEEGMQHETQSTASSDKKVVMEEIDDDEFFLRKRGISQDNIELRQYISDAIREGYDMPINALQHVGRTSDSIEYGDYDLPPPKPRRLHKGYQTQDMSQEFGSQRSDYGDDLSMSQNGSDFFGAPKRPMRKGRSRSKYSMDSQDMPSTDERNHHHHVQYFDDDEEYLRPPRTPYKEHDEEMNDLNLSYPAEKHEVDAAAVPHPEAPRRRKRQLRDTASMEKDSYINGFAGRSVSNSYLQPTEELIVYRTEHEYHIPPLATPENLTDGDLKSRSASRYDEDDRNSHGGDSMDLDGNLRQEYERDATAAVQEKFIIEMMENDGYAIVRKDHIPKPTPPARRKKFSRSPGERFATMPNMRSIQRQTPPPERPPPPRYYTATVDEPAPPLPQRKSLLRLDATQNYDDDYEEPEALELERAESPRSNLQSGEIINKMKYRPLPPPPRPPREKRQRDESRGSTHDGLDESERIATSSTADSYDYESDQRIPEVEVSTQTDPLPDDFVCEEFEITPDLKVIEPRWRPKTLSELLSEGQAVTVESPEAALMTEDEQLARGLQRFRDANQRSLSERSRASSQADRSKSLSRPQTPSAVVIERRVSTPVPSQHSETMLEASLIVRPIDDLDLEEEALRREGLLTDSSQHSKSDIESRYQAETEDEATKAVLSDLSFAPSSVELDETVDNIRDRDESDHPPETDDMEIEHTIKEPGRDYESEHTMRDYGYDDDKLDHAIRQESYESTDIEHATSEHSFDGDKPERTMRDQAYDDEEAENIGSDQGYDDVKPERTMREQGYDDVKPERTMRDPDYDESQRRMSNEAYSEAERTLRDRAYYEMERRMSDQASIDPERTMRDQGYDATKRKISHQDRTMRDHGNDDEDAERYSNHYDEDETEIAALQLEPKLVTDEITSDRFIEQPKPSYMESYFKHLEDDVKTAELCQEDDLSAEEPSLPPPQPPPRRKSTTALETTPMLTIVEQPSMTKDLTPVRTLEQQPQTQPQLPTRMADLEVERLRVHALQAGQIMVKQLHGAQISSDELECKSGNLLVQNISLPPGFIEDIVERVRSTTERGQLYAAETQTSNETLSVEAKPVQELVPPPKPPRHRDLETHALQGARRPDEQTQTEVNSREFNTQTARELSNLDEQTQTEPTAAPLPVYPPVEYLQQLAPLAFYNLHREAKDDTTGDGEPALTTRHRHRHHHRHQRRHSSSSDYSGEGDAAEETKHERLRQRSRSATRPAHESQTLAQATRQFLSACSISLVDIINQLTTLVRGGPVAADETRLRHVPALVVLFVVITFALLIFLLSGKNVHTHHWDYFNPPGNTGRES